MNGSSKTDGEGRQVQIAVATATIAGDLIVPARPAGIVLFAHGSGSSRRSPRNRYVAQALRHAGLATLLMDLLTPDEETVDGRTAEHRFDIPLLGGRLVACVDWLTQQAETKELAIGLFGASTGAAAALMAAADRASVVRAVVSRGGRPDLATAALPRVQAATLLIVGGNDDPVIGLNRQALAQIATDKRLEIIPGAGHLFEEPGALEKVAQLAAQWFRRFLAAQCSP
ncbi:MAG: dienelactone hydrolase family protein [Chloroflexi bacterium]|nr:dienelactone hydrolase family protein [Chloroflexota bacterium]